MSNNFYKDLKKYFKNTSKEDIQKDWIKSIHLDDIGITCDKFLEIRDIENEKILKQT
jgi:hypothetical protein